MADGICGKTNYTRGNKDRPWTCNRHVHHVGSCSWCAWREPGNSMYDPHLELRVAESEVEELRATVAKVEKLADLWVKSEGVEDPKTRVTNRAYAGVLLSALCDDED